MKRIFHWLGACSAVMLLMAACSGHQQHEEHDHDSHEGHVHDAGHDHEHHHAEEAHGGHQSSEGMHTGEIVIAPEQAEAAGIIAEVIEPKNFSQVIAVSGEILPAQSEEQTVVANVAGVVSLNRQLVDGIVVSKGMDLLTLSSSNMADGNPAERARIAYEAARQEYERAARLVDSKIVSEKEFVRIKEVYENARLTYEALQRSGQEKGGVIVEAPVSGYVKNCLVKEGDYVNVGQTLFTISRDNRLYLRADVPEKYYASLRKVRSAHFHTSYDDKVYALDSLNGRLLSYGRQAGEGNFYLPVTFEMDNDGSFVPNSYAEVWLLMDEIPNVLFVPSSALTEEQGLYFVYVQLDESCYERREVKVGVGNGREVQLLSGVHAGERVVTHGAYHVRLASVSKVIPGHSHEH